jgi:hypothetical protein
MHQGQIKPERRKADLRFCYQLSAIFNQGLLAPGYLAGGIKILFGLVPVHYTPPRLQIIRPAILVEQIV